MENKNGKDITKVSGLRLKEMQEEPRTLKTLGVLKLKGEVNE